MDPKHAKANSAGPDLIVNRFGITPVKGLRMQEPPEILIDESGAVGDRDFVIVDHENKIVSMTLLGKLVQLIARYDAVGEVLAITSPDGTVCEDTVRLGKPVAADYIGMAVFPSREVLGPWNDLLSEVAGKPLRLVKTDEPGGGTDDRAVTLLSDASVAELERSAGIDNVDPRRFRMLINFAAPTAHIEDTWKDRIITVGEVRLRVGGPVGRCASITRHPEQGERDAPLVRAIRDYRGTQEVAFRDIRAPSVPFGVYADVIEGGRVKLGDAIQLQDA